MKEHKNKTNIKWTKRLIFSKRWAWVLGQALLPTVKFCTSQAAHTCRVLWSWCHFPHWQSPLHLKGFFLKASWCCIYHSWEKKPPQPDLSSRAISVECVEGKVWGESQGEQLCIPGESHGCHLLKAGSTGSSLPAMSPRPEEAEVSSLWHGGWVSLPCPNVTEQAGGGSW